MNTKQLRLDGDRNMGTEMITPNGNGCIKKRFASQQDAEAFHEKNCAQFGGVRQAPYLCEQCPMETWHLSAMDVVAHELSKNGTNARAISEAATFGRMEKNSEGAPMSEKLKEIDIYRKHLRDCAHEGAGFEIDSDTSRVDWDSLMLAVSASGGAYPYNGWLWLDLFYAKLIFGEDGSTAVPLSVRRMSRLMDAGASYMAARYCVGFRGAENDPGREFATLPFRLADWTDEQFERVYPTVVRLSRAVTSGSVPVAKKMLETNGIDAGFLQEAVKTFVKKNGELGKCCKCGEQTTKVAKVTSVPRHIAESGTVRLPFCDRHFEEFMMAGKTRRTGLTGPFGIGGRHAN